jgi:hypothetical protein
MIFFSTLQLLTEREFSVERQYAGDFEIRANSKFYKSPLASQKSRMSLLKPWKTITVEKLFKVSQNRHIIEIFKFFG